MNVLNLGEKFRPRYFDFQRVVYLVNACHSTIIPNWFPIILPFYPRLPDGFAVDIPITALLLYSDTRPFVIQYGRYIT